MKLLPYLSTELSATELSALYADKGTENVCLKEDDQAILIAILLGAFFLQGNQGCKEGLIET